MATDDDRERHLEDVAGDILDGNPIDWSALPSDDATNPSLDAELRALEILARLHRQLAAPPITGPEAASPGDATAIGEWGPLRLRSRLGAGAFGEVFRAWDTRLDREVALKLLRAAPPVSHKRGSIVEEGRLLARVRHPNVVTVFGAERIGDRVGIWTELVDGRTLADRVAHEGPMPAATAAAIGIDLCGALAAVHAAGLVHGDVKAQNVIQEPGGRVVLVDLGTGREHLANTEESAGLSGTPIYMAPELWRGASPAPGSDLYSLGVLLYYLVTGTYPVQGSTASEVGGAHTSGRRQRLRGVRGDIDPRFASIVDRAIDPDPHQRYADASSMAQALRAVTTPAGRTRIPLVAGALLVVIAGALAAMVAATPSPGTAPRPAASEERRQIDVEGLSVRGRPSKNGSFLPAADGHEQVVLVNLETQERTALTNDQTGFSDFTLASQDGSRVAYAWYSKRQGVDHQLRVIARSGGRPETIVTVARDAIGVEPLDWTSDTRALLYLVYPSNGRRELWLFNESDRHRQLWQDPGLTGARFSPDGRYVVFDAVQGPADSRRDIHVLDLTRLQEPPRPITPNPSDDRDPLWTAGGDLLFLSDRARSTGLYRVRVRDGAAASEPQLVLRDLPVTRVLGLTNRGELVYEAPADTADVYLASVDIARSGPVGSPAPISFTQMTGNSDGTWSPDGRRFAYQSRRPRTVFVRDLQVAGNSREFETTLMSNGLGLTWSPDGQGIAVFGTTPAGVKGRFRLELEPNASTTLIAPMAVNGLTAWPSTDRFLYWDNGRGIVSRRPSAESDEVVVVERAEIPGRARGFAVSPDGQSIAYMSQPSADGPFSLRVKGTTGPARELAAIAGPGAFLQGWTKSNDLVYTQRSGTEGPFHLWALAVTEPAQPRDLGPLPGYSPANPRVAIRPDGLQIAYTQGVYSHRLWTATLPTAR